MAEPPEDLMAMLKQSLIDAGIKPQRGVRIEKARVVSSTPGHGADHVMVVLSQLDLMHGETREFKLRVHLSVGGWLEAEVVR